MGSNKTRSIKYKKKNTHKRRGGGSGRTNINIGFHAPALGMITKGNRKFKDYDGDKLTSVVNMTHNTSIRGLVDNIDEKLASIVYGKTEQEHPQPVYKKHISIQVPPFTDVSPITPSFNRPVIDDPILPSFNRPVIDDPILPSFNRPVIGDPILPSFNRPVIGDPDIGVPVQPSLNNPDIGVPVQPSLNNPDIGTETINPSTNCVSGNTHYETLGVDENATIDKIRNAYRIKSRLCHPDKRPGDIYAVIQQSEINNAKDILFDVEKRKQYDKYLHDKKRKSKKRRNRKTLKINS